MRMARVGAICALLAISVAGATKGPARAAIATGTKPGQMWLYGGGPAQRHYSPLAQINRSNVRQLKQVWSYDTGETGGMESSPLVADGVLYGFTPSLKVIALNAASGKLLWKFDSGVRSSQPSRGLSWWAQGKDHRLFAGIMNYLYALDPKTGRPIASFGENGRIDLREGLGRKTDSVSIALTSPAMIYHDLLIVGGREPETLPAAPGSIRAYDVHTGKLRWTFHTIPQPREPGYRTWPKNAWTYEGAANNWAGMALDARRGILYVPTGSAAFDFYGGNRVGDDLYANCLLALNAETGKLMWYFQGVRHDIWDRDFPSPPALLKVKHDGHTVDAIAQTSKQGYVYLFDRRTGAPLFPIRYRKYPASNVPDEVAAAEQGLPVRPAPFARQRLTEDTLTQRTPAAHQWALDEFRKYRSDGQFLPFTVGQPTVVFPGFDGGAEWGGPAVDPSTGILYVNANDVAWTGALEKNGRTEASGQSLYLSRCSMCHRDNRAGSPPDFPSLIQVGQRLTPVQIGARIREGKGRMPGFTDLSPAQLQALVAYLVSGESKELHGKAEDAKLMPYRFTGYHKFLDPQGYPAVAPPWGTLNAIDLNTGKYLWKIPLGVYPELAAKGMTHTGTENYGGPIVTAGGLVFIAATNFDNQFRAFDSSTGALVWHAPLPYAGNDTPATYAVHGRQYVVIAAGGGKAVNHPSGGVYVAFALPQ